MGTVIPPTSPWTFYSSADDSGVLISATVTFTGLWNLLSPALLTGMVIIRAANCRWTRLILGDLDPMTGEPTNGAVVFSNIAIGENDYLVTALTLHGLVTIADIQNASQITAAD